MQYKLKLAGDATLQCRAFLQVVRNMKLLDIFEAARVNPVLEKFTHSSAFMWHLAAERTPREVSEIFLHSYLTDHFPWEQSIRMHFPLVDLHDLILENRSYKLSNTDYLNCFIRLARASWFRLRYDTVKKTPPTVELQTSAEHCVQFHSTIKPILPEVDIIFPNVFRSRFSSYQGIPYNKVTDHALIRYTESADCGSLTVLFCASLEIIIEFARRILETEPCLSDGDENNSCDEDTQKILCGVNYLEKRTVVRMISGNLEYYYIVQLY